MKQCWMNKVNFKRSKKSPCLFKYVYRCITVSAYKYMLVLVYLCVFVSAWIYVSVYMNLSYCNRQHILFETHIVKRNNATKCFLKWKQNIRSEKKVSPSFRFETKITKLKRSEKFETNRSEKWTWIFEVNKRNTCESNPGRLNVYKKKGERRKFHDWCDERWVI